MRASASGVGGWYFGKTSCTYGIGLDTSLHAVCGIESNIGGVVSSLSRLRYMWNQLDLLCLCFLVKDSEFLYTALPLSWEKAKGTAGWEAFGTKEAQEAVII